MARFAILAVGIAAVAAACSGGQGDQGELPPRNDGYAGPGAPTEFLVFEGTRYQPAEIISGASNADFFIAGTATKANGETTLTVYRRIGDVVAVYTESRAGSADDPAVTENLGDAGKATKNDGGGHSPENPRPDGGGQPVSGSNDSAGSESVSVEVSDGNSLRATWTRWEPSDGDEPVHSDDPGENLPPPVEPTDHEVVAEPAPIESFELQIMESYPVQYAILIVSGLQNSCVSFEGFDVTREGNSMKIEVTNLVSAPGTVIACAEVYGMVESLVQLGSDFTSGETYLVEINDQSMEFVAQ